MILKSSRFPSTMLGGLIHVIFDTYASCWSTYHAQGKEKALGLYGQTILEDFMLLITCRWQE